MGVCVAGWGDGRHLSVALRSQHKAGVQQTDKPLVSRRRQDLPEAHAHTGEA